MRVHFGFALNGRLIQLILALNANKQANAKGVHVSMVAFGFEWLSNERVLFDMDPYIHDALFANSLYWFDVENV